VSRFRHVNPGAVGKRKKGREGGNKGRKGRGPRDGPEEDRTRTSTHLRKREGKSNEMEREDAYLSAAVSKT